MPVRYFLGRGPLGKVGHCYMVLDSPLVPRIPRRTRRRMTMESVSSLSREQTSVRVGGWI